MPTRVMNGALTPSLLLALLRTFAATSPCPIGWTPSPNASWAHQCYGIPTQRSSSLRSCVELCGAEGGVPACIGSVEENAFAAGLIGDDWAWLGLYQNDTSNEPATGWGRCVTGEELGFSGWADDQPGNWRGAGDCAVMDGGSGTWFDAMCKRHGTDPDPRPWRGRPMDWLDAFVCLCSGPANASAVFSEDLEALEAAAEARIRRMRAETKARVAMLYPIVTLIVLLPALLRLGCRSIYNMPDSPGAADRAPPTRTCRIYNMLRGGGAAFCDDDDAHLPSAAPNRTSQGTRETAFKATARKLRAAHSSAARRRLQVSGAMGQLGWALVVFAFTPYVMAWRGQPIGDVVGAYTHWILLFPVGGSLLLLALLPTDARPIRTVCAGFFVIFFFFFGLPSLRATPSLAQNDDLPYAIKQFLSSAVFLATAAALAPTLPCGGCTRLPVMQPRQALRRAWLVARLFFVGRGVLNVGFYSAHLATDRTAPDWIAYGALCLLCALVATPRNRGRLHRWLGGLGGRGSEEEEAAAVAALVGSRRADPDKALACAAKHFRCLRAGRLVAADLAGSGLNNPRVMPSAAVATSPKELAAKTEPAVLGEVSCFLSHSWRDEDEAPGAKYEVFERWARRYQEKTGEEATVWLVLRPLRLTPLLHATRRHTLRCAAQDKACIEQDNIDRSLTCLPIFLAGCKTLLIIAGPTYCTRLWVRRRPANPRTALAESSPALVSCLRAVRNGALHLSADGWLS